MSVADSLPPVRRRAGPYTELDTPSVIVDLAPLERNVAEMAGLARGSGVAPRPHVKTHKTPQIAQVRLDAGAAGPTCAKIREAEALADAGFTNLFVCYPVARETKTRRLSVLAERPGLSISTIVDSPQGVAALSDAFAEASEPLETLVKVDTGLGRVGVPPGTEAVNLALAVAAAPGLRFGEVCAHEGFTYGLPDPEERAAAALARAEASVRHIAVVDFGPQSKRFHQQHDGNAQRRRGEVQTRARGQLPPPRL